MSTQNLQPLIQNTLKLKYYSVYLWKVNEFKKIKIKIKKLNGV